ncbi:ABC transporter permease [Geodermatophilus africanus]|uniref:ABC transporter permease n=1 Tax=Geodermatophilus africanus TaxID=1137993 RepID=UPI000AA58249|nr:ABC transporter permease [Geodermatophilus africanus]
MFGGTLGDGLGGDWLALIAFLVMMTFAFIWLSVAFGLASKSVEPASSVGMPLVLLPFLGSGFVPTDSMPTALRWFAEYQPFTPLIDTVRGSWREPRAEPVLLSPLRGRPASPSAATCGHGRCSTAPHGERANLRGSGARFAGAGLAPGRLRSDSVRTATADTVVKREHRRKKP